MYAVLLVGAGLVVALIIMGIAFVIVNRSGANGGDDPRA